MKRYSTLKILEVEDVVVGVVKVVEVVKAAILKDVIKRMDSRINQNGVQEDVVKEEVAGRITPTSNATSLGSMVITERIVTHTNAITVVKWDILQKIIESKRR